MNYNKSTKREFLKLYEARENNLQGIDLDICHDLFTVFVGVSGSGKSSLAFDTIYAEGGRRYIETFSPYTRQFLDRLHAPKLGAIQGVRPALALEQRRSKANSRSTVGTATELNDYLKIIWSNISSTTCPGCNCQIENITAHSLANHLLSRYSPESSETLLLGFSLKTHGLSSSESLRDTLLSQGFIRIFDIQTGQLTKLEESKLVALQEFESQKLRVIIDRFPLKQKTQDRSIKRRLINSIAECFLYGRGSLTLITTSDQQPCGPDSFTEENWSQGMSCPRCSQTFPQPRPALFTFNSPIGACPTCRGFGNILELDPELLVPNTQLSLKEGAISCWTTKATSWERTQMLKFAKEQEIALDTPWYKLPKTATKLILHGQEKSRYTAVYPWFAWLETKRYKTHVRVFLAQYRREITCPDCAGARLHPNNLIYRVNGLTIPELWQLPIDEARDFVAHLAKAHADNDILQYILPETVTRLNYLLAVGLPYLTLDRPMKTLSGGESQRVNLTSLIGSQLCNTTVILDEPTVGLHPRDTSLLLDVVRLLRDQGNTVLAVEHDTEVIMAADQVVEIGPAAGSSGGQIVFQGTPEELLSAKTSLSSKYLSSSAPLPLPRKLTNKLTPNSKQPTLQLRGARANNLKDLDIDIPLNRLVVVTGISGSGKSSLVEQSLYDSYLRLAAGNSPKEVFANKKATASAIIGLEQLEEIVLVDQTPLVRNPRATPATYSGAWDIIRNALANTVDANNIGASPSSFSYNVDGGRCPHCKGAGAEKVEMQFLSDVFVECEYCRGGRFQDQILTVRLGQKNVDEWLKTPIDQAIEELSVILEEREVARLSKLLQPLSKLGLGYLALGHPISNISGGEAQRLKLASHLSESSSRATLFILDEPTTGLHPHNIKDLLQAFAELLDLGHSLLVVEHNLELIAAADWLIDLGPEGGKAGGQLILSGNPLKLSEQAKSRARSQTVAALAERLQPKIPTKERKSANAPLSFAAKKRNKKQTDIQPPISVIGARHHNLKNVSVQIPKNQLTCITGVSGSGKSTLAFDILFSEGQRRFIDSLSPYARQFIKQLERPEVDQVYSIPPTIAVSQKTAPPAGISTIATTTEIYQYLRLLFAKVGIQHCPNHSVPLIDGTAHGLAELLLQNYEKERIFLLAPVVSGRKGNYQALFQRALRADISQAIIDNKLTTLTDELRLDRNKLHWIALVIGSLVCSSRNHSMLIQAIEQCLIFSGGDVEIAVQSLQNKRTILSTARGCPVCKTGFRELDPQDFSFRSNRGMCPSCHGRGILTKNSKVIVCPSCKGARLGEIAQNVFIAQKAIHDYSSLTAPELLSALSAIDFPARLQPVVRPILQEITHRLQIIEEVGLGYLSLDRDSSTISGGEAQRLRLATSLGSPLSGVCYIFDEPTIGLHVQDHAQVMSILRHLKDNNNTVVVVEHDPDTIQAADYVIDLGPGGGADGGQIMVAAPIDQFLVADNSATANALLKRYQELPRNLSPRPTYSRQTKEEKDPCFFQINQATCHNLKNVSASFQLNALNVVCGVSGSGKSSLVHGSLIPALEANFSSNRKEAKTKMRRSSNSENIVFGADQISKVIEVDQSPIGRTISSTPASYLGVFDEIRKVFALVPEARARGWNASFFSCNTGKGRCQECQGRGFLKVPMSFLPDAVSTCEGCHGLRYSEEAASVLFHGYSIGELLQLTFSQAQPLFINYRKIYRLLDLVCQLGLGYLRLGQPTSTLSGGEAQRIKIATELGRSNVSGILYVLDEPTIGLHMKDVDRLMNMLGQLISRGNTILVIEHDMSVIMQADHLVELGPGPGKNGGEVVFSGSPSQLQKTRVKTATATALKEILSPRTKANRPKLSSNA